MFTLYLKTKNSIGTSGHFRDYHPMLTSRRRKFRDHGRDRRARGSLRTTLRSIGHIARLQRVADNDADFVTPETCWQN
jgi:starvation-inducible DNA-binding protein